MATSVVGELEQCNNGRKQNGGFLGSQHGLAIHDKKCLM